METNPKLIYQDISNALDLQGLYNQELKLQEIFENLPAEERNVFNNDYYQFKENGLKYYETKAQKEIEEANEIRKKESETPVKVEITNKGE